MGKCVLCIANWESVYVGMYKQANMDICLNTHQGCSDGGYIGILYLPPKKISPSKLFVG